MRQRRWGWIVGVAAALLVAGALYSSGGAGESRGPSILPNPNARAPEVTASGSVLHVVTEAPAEVLVVDTVPPTEDVTLLWFEGRGTATSSLGSVVLDAAAAPIRFDHRLRPERLRFRLDGREPASVAQSADGTFWVATTEGSLIHLDARGAIADTAAATFDFSQVTADPAGRVWAVRSPEQFSFPFRFDPEPLIQPVGHTDSIDVLARRPHNPIFLHLVNAGRIAFAEDGGVFYAPFIRDEIIRFSPDGDTVWVASRGMQHGVEEPSFGRDDAGQPVLDYAPVNLGLQIGPDGLLYVLSTPENSTTEGRLDVIDPDSGMVRRTAVLPTSIPTLAVDETGRVYLLDDFRLLTGTAPAEREALAPFDLEEKQGGRLRLADYEGSVVLINFWASWCLPCREEMPALNALAESFDDEESFAFISLSDDVQPDKAIAFIDELGFTFPVGFGKGKLRQEYHYLGLPFTVLVDAEGHIVQRWSGFAGEDQIAAVRNVIRTELDRMTDVAQASGQSGGHMHHEMH